MNTKMAQIRVGQKSPPHGDINCKDGKVIKVEGNKTLPGTNGRICVKGAAMQQALYHENRLKYPMKRVGARGEGRFERISWDEAFSTIAERLKESKERYGAKSTLFYVGHPKWFRYQLTELANAYGTPNVGTESSTCAYAIMMANRCCFGQGVGFLMPDMARCKVLCAWGANVLHSNSITQGSGLMRIAERGTKLVVIDPRCTPTSERAEIHLRPIPGTDGALALGMARVIITEGLQNQEYIDRYTLGYEEYRDYVMQFTPQKVEELTGVPQQDMIKAARMLAENAPFSLMTTAWRTTSCGWLSLATATASAA
ncbi:MAG: molybdopterin-dependent oxidoreductase [Negativibacillus sp.]|nr:molybdopterin-dependent oxidoreductase [Negativibacillus sp.]